ncbi:MAG: diguanylate cyclase [Clostridia bacterium]|nr:diguanylate cyclase [Clostridia bacterium]
MKMIRKIMSIIGITFLIPLIVMMIHLTTYEHIHSTLIHTMDMQNLVKQLNKSVEDYLDELVRQVSLSANTSVLKRFISEPANAAYENEAKEEINNAALFSETICNVSILNADGKFLLSSLPTAASYNESILRKVLSEKQSQVDLSFITENNNTLFSICAPMIVDNAVKGYYVAFVDASIIKQLLSISKRSISDVSFIIDGADNLLIDGVIVPISAFQAPKASKGIGKALEIIKSRDDGNLHTIYFTNQSGVKMRGVVQKSPALNIYTVYARPQNDILANRNAVLHIILFYILLISICAVAAYRYVNRYLKNPFDEIFRTIEIYEMGDWTYKPVIKGNDELGLIANALCRLAENLNKMYMDIKFNEYRYRLAMEFSSDIIYDYNISQNIFESDRRKWENIFDFRLSKNQKQIEENFIERIHPEDKKIYEDYCAQLDHDCCGEIEKQTEIEFRIRLKDGNYHWLSKKDILVKGVSDKIEHIMGTLIVIDERKNRELSLKKKATTDSLTTLYNRAAFISKTQEITENRIIESGAMIFVDIDDFKNINDSYGHDVGDDVLRFIGISIKEAVGNCGIGGRYGGDEFLAFIYDKEKAVEVSESILLQLARKFIIRGTDDTISIKSSIGIAYYPDHAKDTDSLIKKADTAMYYSKNNGKNRYTIYTEKRDDTEQPIA